MPSTLSAAAPRHWAPPPLDWSGTAPLELHRMDVVKTLGDSTCTWMQGDTRSWIKLIWGIVTYSLQCCALLCSIPCWSNFFISWPANGWEGGARGREGGATTGPGAGERRWLAYEDGLHSIRCLAKKPSRGERIHNLEDDDSFTIVVACSFCSFFF